MDHEFRVRRIAAPLWPLVRLNAPNDQRSLGAAHDRASGRLVQRWFARAAKKNSRQ